MNTPAKRPDIKAAIQALADVVLGDRADRQLLEVELITSLSVEVNDFVRHNPVEFAHYRLRDHEILKQLYRKGPA